jgi:hypothetical protein
MMTVLGQPTPQLHKRLNFVFRGSLNLDLNRCKNQKKNGFSKLLNPFSY